MGVIREAMSSGLTLLDTADAYGPYDNQVLIGEQKMSLHAHSLAQQIKTWQGLQKHFAPLQV